MIIKVNKNDYFFSMFTYYDFIKHFWEHRIVNMGILSDNYTYH